MHAFNIGRIYNLYRSETKIVGERCCILIFFVCLLQKHSVEVGNWNVEDFSKFTNYSNVKDWNDKKLIEGLRDRFVTGDWSKAAKRNQDTEATFEDEDAVFGDFEDLETGEKHTNETSNVANHKQAGLDEEERRLKKLALRAKFDAQYPFDTNGFLYFSSNFIYLFSFTIPTTKN